MSEFWSGWISLLTIITLALITWILFATRRMKSHNDDNTTGHNFDGIIEEDNPLPQWWLILFVFTLVFGVGYLLAYPGLGNYAGWLGWTSAQAHDEEAHKVAEKFKQSASEFSSLGFAELIQHSGAIKAGRRLYANNCSVCHGANAGGATGFPDLSNSHWQWGGSEQQIIQSITFGRRAAMPGWSSVISDRDIDILVDYLLIEAPAEYGHSHAQKQAAQQSSPISRIGNELYSTYCAACHGADMTGNTLLGAPSLVDDEWLYGASLTQVKQTIVSGRNGVMPAHQGLLSKEKYD